MTNKEQATALWAIVMDRTQDNATHRKALDDLIALKKKAKTSLDKLGVPQVMWDREDVTNLKNAELAADLGAASDEQPLKDVAHAVDEFIMSDEELAGQKDRKKPDADLEANLSKTDVELIEEAKPISLKQVATPDGGKALVSHTAPITLQGKVVGVGLKAPKTEEEPKPSKEERGQISKTVRHMLINTSLPYKEMVERIKAKHPSAKTTARSIASVASDLRKAGFSVAERQKGA